MGYGSIGAWTTLLAVQAGAAATLTGLVFVAVSLNLKQIMAVRGLPGRAAEAILQFVEVFFIASAGLIPGQSEQAFAIEVLVLGIFFWVLQVWGQAAYLRLRTGYPWSWFVHRAVLAQLATVPFCVCGIALLLQLPGAIYWLVPGFAFSFIAAIVSAWVLLVEILR